MGVAGFFFWVGKDRWFSVGSASADAGSRGLARVIVHRVGDPSPRGLPLAQDDRWWHGVTTAQGAVTTTLSRRHSPSPGGHPERSVLAQRRTSRTVDLGTRSCFALPRPLKRTLRNAI